MLILVPLKYFLVPDKRVVGGEKYTTIIFVRYKRYELFMGTKCNIFPILFGIKNIFNPLLK